MFKIGKIIIQNSSPKLKIVIPGLISSRIVQDLKPIEQNIIVVSMNSITIHAKSGVKKKYVAILLYDKVYNIFLIKRLCNRTLFFSKIFNICRKKQL
ncbi:MAG: hypothetical protein D8M57_05370 [Candidatus Scalindua sp. AMX11]|nr:MAG: hypothetical protein DWQ00_07415 [Candidatus Scalindua sp.]TDE65970.1 MAG: hypothetical protein D8M57_05370 [Candidatus Scalindua sp. AMX11]